MVGCTVCGTELGGLCFVVGQPFYHKCCAQCWKTAIAPEIVRQGRCYRVKSRGAKRYVVLT